MGSYEPSKKEVRDALYNNNLQAETEIDHNFQMQKAIESWGRNQE